MSASDAPEISVIILSIWARTVASSVRLDSAFSSMTASEDSPAATRRVLYARVHTWRHSGSATSSMARLRSGSSLGRKGAASMGSSTSLHMLSMMTADLRLMAVICWKKRPRWRRGPMMERVGASTCWTKVVAASLWTHSGTSSTLWMHSMRVGMKGSMSMLPTHLPHFSIVAVDACFTSSRMCTITCASSGIISGRHAATALGLRSMKESRRVRAAVVDCQNWDWNPVKMGLSAARTANSESLAGNAAMATAAASRTFLDLLSPARVMATSRRSMSMGSSATVAALTSSVIFSAAALRASSSFFFVESATTASITSLVILEDAGVLHLAGAMIAVGCGCRQRLALKGGRWIGVRESL
mmetsp:Transcript_3591/g.15784  ORF Transcript_3591/g.15784 Transcript_3591/m.15784 type:complete len:358 (-) Transcript_3591:22-1095(-)